MGLSRKQVKERNQLVQAYIKDNPAASDSTVAAMFGIASSQRVWQIRHGYPPSRGTPLGRPRKYPKGAKGGETRPG